MKTFSQYIHYFFAASLLLLSFNTQAELININQADAATLDHYLLGIGEKKAQRIIEYREENGGFSSIEEIMEVSGIGEKTFAKNQEQLSISEGISHIGQKSKPTQDSAKQATTSPEATNNTTTAIKTDLTSEKNQ